VEGLGVGIADARDDVPVVARSAEGERRARGDDVESPLRVEVVPEREQIGLVGATAVMEHEEPCRGADGRPLAVCQIGHRLDHAGAGCSIVEIDAVDTQERRAGVFATREPGTVVVEPRRT
jgi:hypothetical protein